MVDEARAHCAMHGIADEDHNINKPWSKILSSPYTVSVVGAGFKGGQPKNGVDEGPNAIRHSGDGLTHAVKTLGWTLNDHDNLRFETFATDEATPSGMKNPRTVGSATHKVFEKVSEAASKGEFCLTLGGDHSIAIGTISGQCKARNNSVVVWVDAHGDINTSETSPTGNLHGMPVAFLMGLIKEKVPGFEWLKPCLTSDRIVYIGLRDVDAGERKILKENNILAYSMTEVDKYGIGKIMEMALNHVNPQRDRPIHLSFDVDGIDPHWCPSTGTRVKGGLSYREARYICTSLAETGLLVGLDVVEVNPLIGSPQDSAETCAVSIDLIKCALGERLL